MRLSKYFRRYICAVIFVSLGVVKVMVSRPELGLLVKTFSLAALAGFVGYEISSYLVPYLSLERSWDASAQTSNASNQAKVVEIIDGNEVYVQGKQAEIETVATSGQTVSTGVSRAQLQFTNQAIARLNKNSKLTLGRCTQLERGSILVSGAVSTCTTNITAAVRGTTYYLETNENDEEDLQVLEGEVEVTDRRSASLRQVRVKAGQRFRFQRKLARELFNQRTVVKLSAQDYDNILQGNLSRNFRNDLPTLPKVRKIHQQLFPKAVFPNHRRLLPVRIPKLL